ncbi:sulfotransferase [Rudaea sp.]|uniref:tetratricopeptide repeat-containing sulfotransferase family protein n=1 Tax=Rudaea sp. TaxID=2136325 RepID=UPI00321FCC43
MTATPNRQADWAAAQRLREDGRIDAAADAVIALWHTAQADRDETMAALGFLKECGAQDRALTIARAARQRWPGDARIAAEAGEIALALGLFDEASSALREAVDLDPRQGAAWLRLAHCRRFAEDDADVQRLRRTWSDAGLDETTRTCVGFALGKALDDLGDHAQAARVLTDANARARKASGWHIDDWRRFVDAQLHAPALPALSADADFNPIFVVGLPRSGTTLVASALARHAEVRDRGELNWVPALRALLAEQGHLHNPQALAAIAKVIRAQMRRDDAPARFHLDKNPLNFRHLDFIAACFPNARIVHCRRGARDTALSIWMQHFAHADLGFAYGFAEISRVGKDCTALMAHWRTRLALATIEVDYENFVADPRSQEQRLTDFLGLRMLPADTSAAEKPQIVTTASVWQVRQPVYTHALQRWRRYAPYLPELTTLFPEDS